MSSTSSDYNGTGLKCEISDALGEYRFRNEGEVLILDLCNWYGVDPREAA